MNVGAASADVANGTFDTDVAPWSSYGVDTLEASGGQMCATSTAVNRWDAGVLQDGIVMPAGDKTVSFDVTGEGTYKVVVETPDGTNVLGEEFTVDGTDTFTYDFTATATDDGKVLFEVGGDAAGHTVCFDNISVTDALIEYAPDGGFDDGVGAWFSYGTDSLEAASGALCATTSAANRWDAGVGNNTIPMPAGDKTIAFDVTGDGTFKVVVETPEGTNVLGEEFTVNGTGTFTYDFTATATEVGKVLFEVGGDASGHTVCIDILSITGPAAAPLIEYIENGTFDTDPWFAYGTTSFGAVGGEMCAATNAANRWDAGIGLGGFRLDAGAKHLSFKVTGSGTFKVNVETPEGSNVLAEEFTIAGTESLAYDFSAVATDNAKVVFEVGGDTAGHTVCLDDVSITGAQGGGAEPEEPTAAPTPGVNLLSNGDFESNSAPWTIYANAGSATGDVQAGAYCGAVSGLLVNAYDAGFSYNGIDLLPGDYELSFDASTTGGFTALLQGPSYATLATTPIAGTDLTHYTVPFTVAAEIQGAGLAFQFGPLGDGESFDFCLDNVFLGAPSVEYVDNGNFDTTMDPWQVDGEDSTSIDSGALCVEVPAGTSNPWDVNVHLDGLELPAGPYALKFDASGTGGPMRALVGLGAAPYTVYGEMAETPGANAPYELFFNLAAPSDNAQIAFQIGGSSSAWTFCVDNVSLLSGGAAPTYAPETGPSVRVNQYGYEASGPKHATLVSDAADGVAWELHNASAATVASGTTTPLGDDASAGLSVHDIDFSSFTSAGTFTLVADGQESYPFMIGSDIYAPLQTDALNYFYLARSGIEIDGAIAGADYARAAGHVSNPGGSAVNQGDNKVACQPAADSQAVYGEPWTCDYTLDVVGGWYDAGDHGKYVVNGGIATAQLLSVWERALRAGPSAQDALGDGSLNIPEAANGVPDVLDEAKWELDFMMSMMVPDGEPMAGMVHHKVHDYGWTGLPLLPVNDGQVRYLHRPSTAATLNLAATAAQGARLWDAYDSDYADELLASAGKAWEAALANPAVYAPAADGSNGGGPYDDDASDEFYWAAAELYLTTGDAQYLNYLEASPVHQADSFPTAGFSWDALDAIAKIDLATVDSDLPDRVSVIAQVVAGAEGILAVQQSQEFGVALPDDAFVWGSNSQILNNIVVLGAGYDVSGNAAFLDAAQESMDYVLGRNALNYSYITGYGTVYSENQHSRWFANQLNSELPHPPAGSVAGGPNADVPTWDPTFQSLYPAGDCAAQACYVDDITSYATNEITVNWNSALSAASAFLAVPEARVAIIPTDNNGGGTGTVVAVANEREQDGLSATGSNALQLMLLSLLILGAGGTALLVRRRLR
jgi:endoglucanase